MRYIRTKDGIYNVSVSEVKNLTTGFTLEKQYQYAKYVDQEDTCTVEVKSFNESDVIKQADTIEELIDEYVVDNCLIEIFERDGELAYTDINNYETFCRFGTFHKLQDVYGAIWTDKGLIYVAKMNKEGELELL